MTIDTVKAIMHNDNEYDQKLENECGAFIMGFSIIDAVIEEDGYWTTTTVGYDINEEEQEMIDFSILFRAEMSDNKVVEKIYQTAKEKVLTHQKK